MIYRIYNVMDKTGHVVKIGSTIRTLSVRGRRDPYNTSEYEGCQLGIKREFEWPDSDKDFGNLLRYVREQFDISKNHLWWDEGGWNKDEPVRSYLYGFDGSVGGRIGGKVAVRKAKENKTGLFATDYDKTKGGRNAQITQRKKGLNFHNLEFQSKQGYKGGSASLANGHPAKANGGRVAGPIVGRKAVENKTGIFAVDWIFTNPIDSRPQDQSKGRHNRWHTNRNTFNEKCSLCLKERDGEGQSE